MKKEKEKLIRKLTVRLTPTEYNKIHSAFKRSTKRKLSEYARCILLQKPVTVFTRNQSMDDFVAELIQLKNELNAIGNNFNQAVKKLHTLHMVRDIKMWAEWNEKSKEIFFQKTEEIFQKIKNFSNLWLQE